VKRLTAGIIYLLAFIAHFHVVNGMRIPGNYQKWLDIIRTFGGKPLPGTQFLIDTLAYWWAYPLAGSFVFCLFFLYLKKSLIPCIFMISIALLWWGYYYIPVIQIGRPV